MGSVAASVRWRLLYLQVHFDGEFDAEKLALKPKRIHRSICFYKAARLTDLFVVHRKTLGLILGVVKEPLTIALIDEYRRLGLYLRLHKLVVLLKGMLDRIAFDEVTQLRLIDRPALLLLHDVIPGADIRLTLDEDGNPRLNFVVAQHRGIVCKKIRLSISVAISSRQSRWLIYYFCMRR